MSQTTEVSESLISLILSGGVASTLIMLLLLLFLIITFYVGIERFLTYRSVLKELSRAESAIFNELLQRATSVYNKTNSPEKTEKALEQMAGGYVFELERNTSILATFSGAAPMLGFLGTVIGMILAFREMAVSSGQAEISSLAGGIYTAMITTVGGLIVGILSYIAYNQLAVLLACITKRLEDLSNELLDSLER
ncbi:MAG: MotA/TolQ/ExbB proton channel family protein [Flavobacteriaceae bacterium]|nr:MotA/TolQ/ExbB proton channel family protein [Flavobacteriaceae bacterium]